MSLGNVTQIGLVVRNIEDAAKAWATLLGVAVPDIIETDPVERAHTEYQGRPSTARAKLAFFHLGQVDIELIEPIGEPSTWKDGLDQRGEGVHHIAFQIKDTGKVVQYLESKGVPMVQQGQYTGGMYKYMDSTKPLGVVIELLENF